MARFHGRRSPLGLGGGHPRGSRRFPLELLDNHRPDFDSGVTCACHRQLSGLSDPTPVSGQFPFGHDSKLFEVDVRPRSEGDEKRRHVMGDIHTAHARLFSLPGWSKHNRWSLHKVPIRSVQTRNTSTPGASSVTNHAKRAISDQC